MTGVSITTCLLTPPPPSGRFIYLAIYEASGNTKDCCISKRDVMMLCKKRRKNKVIIGRRSQLDHGTLCDSALLQSKTTVTKQILNSSTFYKARRALKAGFTGESKWELRAIPLLNMRLVYQELTSPGESVGPTEVRQIFCPLVTISSELLAQFTILTRVRPRSTSCQAYMFIIKTRDTSKRLNRPCRKCRTERNQWSSNLLTAKIADLLW